MSPLPSICRFGQTALEKKLLLYFECRLTMTFEFRTRHSDGYDPTTLPPLMGAWEFVPMFEIGHSVFLFQYKQDRQTAIDHFANYQPDVSKKRERRARRKRKPRASRRLRS